jgi:hypothetical protein
VDVLNEEMNINVFLTVKTLCSILYFSDEPDKSRTNGSLRLDYEDSFKLENV